ncbi:MAG: hypothetical protein U5K56_01175 [Halioglobus sp.]|nr:hypothetical protein [Halioglobus sp.]
MVAPHDEFIAGVDYPHPFDEYAVALVESAARYICILSPGLDHAAFDSEELTEALSALARRSRHTRVRILIADSRDIVSRGHRLLQLARRLPSAVHMQKIPEHPDWKGETVVIRDRDGVLFKPAGPGDDGFYEPGSRASTQRHLELFDELWRYSEEDPELRSLRL